MITEDGYTVVEWPWPEDSDDSEEIDLRIAAWLNDLHIKYGTDSWRYSPGLSTLIEFRDPDDALAFTLFVPPGRRI